MRVLWSGDTPTVSTGFARCTRVVCGELHRAGHDVHVVGISEFGEPHGYPYRIYPPKHRGQGDDLGVRRTALMINALKPDVVVILNDPWNVAEYLDAINELTTVDPKPPVVAWMAVDAKNHPHSKELNQLAHMVCWTQFAVDEMREGGYEGSASIVQLGCNTALFKPMDKFEARERALPAGARDGFIFGVLGRNQPRKRIDLAIEYFAQFMRDYNPTNAYLYLQVAPTGERACDVRAVAAYYGPQLVGRILLAQYDAGVGISDEDMVGVYNSMDVVMTTTQGEGWGLTTHEAMACGVPCIVPDWSALGEWPGDAVVKVPCTTHALNAPLNFFPYTIGGIADRTAFVAAMQRLYCHSAMRYHYGVAGHSLVQRPDWQWSYVGRAMRAEIEGVVSSVRADRDLLAGEIEQAQEMEPELVVEEVAK